MSRSSGAIVSGGAPANSPRSVAYQAFNSVANIAGNASLLTQAFSIPANSVQVGDAFRVTAGGQFHNTTGAGSVMSINFQLGNSQFSMTLSTINVALNTHRKWFCDGLFVINALGNLAVGQVTSSVSSVVAAAGAALWVVANSIVDVTAGSIDTTAPMSVDLRVLSSAAASAQLSCDVQGFSCLYIPKAP